VKNQSAASLQQDYLDAIEIVAKNIAPASSQQAVELLSRYAAELNQQSEPGFEELRAIALLSLSRAQRSAQQAQESERNREEAMAILDRIDEPGSRLNIQDGLANVLIEAGEFRRAIPFCEQAIKLSGRSGDKLANRLWRAGRTYARAGFMEQAEEPLRKAVDFFRNRKADPRTPIILNDLGNALRTVNPGEAEKSYLEAADIWEESGAQSQATTAWVNLGIVCGEQGRLDQSLEWYEKARRVRQADPNTPRARLGSLANNVANLHRRAKRFELATREAMDALALLEGDPVLADAYGTLGLILADQGLDEAALEWFRKSQATHLGQPSPNVAALSEVLGNEAAALTRLGRIEDARAAEQRRAELLGDRPRVHTHDAVPVAGSTGSAEYRGAVLIELDGLHLPEAVYKEYDLGTLENLLEEALESVDEGELDGHESGPETTTVFLYGDDAEALFLAVEQVLRDYPLCQGAQVTIRQDGRERRAVVS
jgi:tetratricopeptide (TPR) repeat protein